MNKEQIEKMANELAEKAIKEKGLDQVIRKLKFHDKPNDKLSKEEKTLKFFQAQMLNDSTMLKDLSGGVSDGGLTLLPIEFHQDIIDRVKTDKYALRNMCTTIPVTYRNGNWPVGATGVVMSWDTENSPITNTNPTFGQIQYSVNRLDGYTAISRDLLADTPVRLYEYLTAIYSKALIKAENLAIISGSGSGQPMGIRTNTDIATVAAKDTTNLILQPDDIINLPYSIDIYYRDPDCCFLVDTSVMKQIRTMKDAIGNYIFKKGDMTQGEPDTICGYKAFEFTSAIPSNLGSGTNQSEIIFGNMAQYYFFDKGEMGSEINTQSDQAFKNHQVLMKMWERIDGQIAIPAAFIRLTGFKAAV
jgi:HK97 family phage major capsid protein